MREVFTGISAEQQIPTLAGVSKLGAYHHPVGSAVTRNYGLGTDQQVCPALPCLIAGAAVGPTSRKPRPFCSGAPPPPVILS